MKFKDLNPFSGRKQLETAVSKLSAQVKYLNDARNSKLQGDLVPMLAAYNAAFNTRNTSSLRNAQYQDAQADLMQGNGGRVNMVTKSRHWFDNSPGAVKITHVCEAAIGGTGIIPTIKAKDPRLTPEEHAAYREWATWRYSVWCKYCDISEAFKMPKVVRILVRSQLVDGEIFIRKMYGDARESELSELELYSDEAPLVTRSLNKLRPRIDIIEGHRVKGDSLQPDNGITRNNDGTYNFNGEALRLIDGILINKHNVPRFYCVLPSTVNASVYGNYNQKALIIPANEIVVIMNRTRTGQIRGTPKAAPGLETSHHLADLMMAEMVAAKDQATISRFMKTASGQDETGETGVGSVKKVTDLDGDIHDKTEHYRQAGLGETIYGQPGDELTLVGGERPSAATTGFWDILDEQVCRSIGLSYAAVRDYRGDWGAAGIRAACVSDNRFFEIETEPITDAAQDIYEFYMSYEHRVALPAGIKIPRDWRSIKWQSQRRGTIDMGRDSAAMLNELRGGVRTYTDVYGESGEDARPQLDQWMDDMKYIEEGCQKRGIKTRPTLFPNPVTETAATVKDPAEADPEDDGDMQEADKTKQKSGQVDSIDDEQK